MTDPLCARPRCAMIAALISAAALYGCEIDVDRTDDHGPVSAPPGSVPLDEPGPSELARDAAADRDSTKWPQSDTDAPHTDAQAAVPASDASSATPDGGSTSAMPDGGSTQPGSGSTGTEGIERDVLRPERRMPTDALIAGLRVPAGFRVSVYARDLGHARMLAVYQPHVFLTRPMQGDVLRLSDRNSDGVPEEQTTVAAGLPQVHGIAIAGPYLYLATPTHVYRASLSADGAVGTPAAIIDGLPAGAQHPNRTLAIGPDRKLYVSVGSPCDACPIDNPEYATLLRFELDGSRREIFASGLRNTIGFGWHPETGELWGFDHGSDWRGDDIPPEELNQVRAGADYGWPYCFGQRRIDPVIQMPPMTTKEAYCAMTTGPALENQAHEAPIGWAFYTAQQFPTSYRGGAFVAFRGSWNRIPAVGYRIAYVVFEGGRPVRVDDFVSGFLIENGTAQFGRLAGIAVGADGSLLFTDDENGFIYKVTYQPSGSAQ